MRSKLRLLVLSLVALALLLPALPPAGAQAPQEQEPAAALAAGFTYFKFPTGQPACTGLGLNVSANPFYTREDCGFSNFTLTDGGEAPQVVAQLFGPAAAEPFVEVAATDRGAGAWRFSFSPNAMWPSGDIAARILVNGEPAGSSTFQHNALGATLDVTPREGGYTSGDDLPVTGTTFTLDTQANAAQQRDVPASFSLRLVAPTGEVRDVPGGPFTAAADGSFAVTVPGSVTAGLTSPSPREFTFSPSLEVVDATFTDPSRGAFARQRAGAVGVELSAAVDQLLVDSVFTSSVGWVKPGEAYPFRVVVRNLTGADASDVRVRVPVVDGATFVGADPVDDAGSAAIAGGVVEWSLGTVPAGSPAEPTVRTLIVNAQADTLGQDPQLSWKSLSATAELTYAAGPAGLSSTSHGPKVIPPNSTYETARYGDRPFPVVPVDFRDRSHGEGSSGAELSRVINDPENEGSTFNLFQEMSYGQLFPDGTVPSAGIASADFGDYDFDFHPDQTDRTTTCQGVTVPEAAGTPLLPERIVDGFYQLPGDTGYYGSDSGGSAISPVASQIDAGCGDTGKSVYDAAAIADPEIDYNDFDTDKDGLVDFFMMVYVGVGGNGVSQTSAPPYDNIWPHSSTLEGGFIDPETGLAGYISDDQLKDLEGRPLYYTDEARIETTTEVTEFPVFVRVGPYNVNPESAIERASVISHEYGHSLGLPDYYSGGGATGSTDFYGTWNLMASDYSQSMDVQARQELGWLIPRVLGTGETRITDMVDSRQDTDRIDWVTPDGQPYTLTGPGVDNGEGYSAKLPSRLVIDPALVENGASPSHVFHSGAGDNFNCPPREGHNLDIRLPQLADLPEGTEITLEYSSLWDIEWDFDYGFTMVTTDDGGSYQALESQEGFTTPASNNPNLNSCQQQFGNGLTGTTQSYEDGTTEIDRRLGEQVPNDGFARDSYDLSEYAGQGNTTLRFAYSTDVGLTRPGWFIDDVVVRAGEQVLYSSDFEEFGRTEDPLIFNGGCQEDLMSGQQCTDGWNYVSTEAGSPADHAYYFELRDRSGFDLDSNGQSDRGEIDWAPGLSLAFTDEAEGYGNSSRDDRPNQHILDSTPQPGELAPNLADAAFGQGERFSDSGAGHVDNYTDPKDPAGEHGDDPAGEFRFDTDCLSLEVTRLEGADAGPQEADGDLTGDVTATTGPGCAPYDYGFGNVDNIGPTAAAQARPTTVEVGQEVGFDASQSFDDVTPLSGLTFTWDFRDDGSVDATGESVRTTYQLPGVQTARLVVTDAQGLTDDTTVPITVVPAGTGGGGGGGGVGSDTATRAAGAGRIETSVRLSQLAFDSADTAVLARADDFPDALTAATLAAEAGGPLLLTGSDALAPEVAAELERLGVTRVYLAGGDVALTPAVESALGELDTMRLAGVDRFETAALVAREVVTLGGDVPEAIVARADAFPDALAASTLAAAVRAPILLTGTDRLSDTTETVLGDLLANGAAVTIAGGLAAVGSEAEASLAAAGYQVTRAAGAERYATAVALVEAARSRGADLEPSILASGVNFPDALAAGPVAHQLGGSLLLVDPLELASSAATADLLDANADEIDTLVIAGGVQAVSQAVEDQALAAIAD